jgi:hypothetical protein
MKDTIIPMSRFPGLRKASEPFSNFDVLAFVTDPGYGYQDVKMLLLKFHKKPGKYDNPDGLGLCIYNIATHEFIEEPADLNDYNDGKLTEDKLYKKYRLKRSSFIPKDEENEKFHIKKFEQFVNEDYSISDVMGSREFVDKDWDTKYDEAHEEPLKSKIKKALVEVFKDSHVMGLVGEQYYWGDGSNGLMNFSNLNHYITDIGYRTYADKGEEIFDDIKKLTDYILYAFASSKIGNQKIYDRYKDEEYNPDDEFFW